MVLLSKKMVSPFELTSKRDVKLPIQSPDPNQPKGLMLSRIVDMEED